MEEGMLTGGRKFYRAWLVATVFALWPFAANPAEQSDAEIVKQMIRESVMTYHGACPCPDNVMRNGRRCGRNSAWSRPGGASPVCYPSDVTTEMIKEWREKHPKTP